MHAKSTPDERREVMTIDEIREIVISPDAIMRKEWGKVLPNEIDRLTQLRQAIWEIVGECMTGITDGEKIAKIEKLLLDSERTKP